MNIEIRTDKNIQNSERLIGYIRAELTNEFQRHSERITHFSVHLSDENGDKGGDDDLRCMIEARLAGLKPIAVSHKAGNVDAAIHGAIERLKRSLEHVIEKKTILALNRLKLKKKMKLKSLLFLEKLPRELFYCL
jgi:ribosome-associated translation inhibitor RaiA